MKTTSEKSVENGIKIIKTAIKKKISLTEASKRANFGKNYVSDIKSRIKDNYKSKRINRNLYSEFTTLIKQYEN